MKLFKLSFGMLVVMFFAMACNNATEPSKTETIHVTTPTPEVKKAEEPAKKDIQVKVGDEGVEFKYEKKD